MITEILALAALTRKLWKKGTLQHRAAAVAIWIAFGAVAPFAARFIEAHVPSVILVAMPCTTITVTFALTVIKRRRIRRFITA